ncbi:organic hydroperoxide resistance protein [Sphingobacterium alkalisoli]|uniref:Organic hydroperoxide resistance protein n=1 Tax=Sphingobacterium alkalisoli TaxID=1874115 RepID=A0A4U0GWM9_9SPHI|nr:organic hydroperoxide resistance protein [Sphingobacterium alkalisoli]TJY63406.1 organic hydroperoxide resistance protein [Sphingobacterium alkalisoli]GGH25871.1 organic hydroperoxide resistance protein [Sphingobacterium alkalisoli]
MSEKLYTAEVTAIGGRNGEVKSSDGVLNLQVRKPVSMGGKGGATNPEQLFAAAWSSCFLGAMGAVSEKDNIDLKDTQVTARTSFNTEGNSSFLSAEIEVHVPSLTKEQTQALIEKAHRVCPYSKAVRGNIETVLKVV